MNVGQFIITDLFLDLLRICCHVSHLSFLFLLSQGTIVGEGGGNVSTVYPISSPEVAILFDMRVGSGPLANWISDPIPIGC